MKRSHSNSLLQLPLSSNKKPKTPEPTPEPTPEQIVFSSPNLVEHILSFIPDSKDKTPRDSFRTFRLLNKTCYSNITPNFIEPFINDFIHLVTIEQMYKVPSNLPLVKSGISNFNDIHKNFIKSYICDITKRINNENQYLFSNLGSYICFMHKQQLSYSFLIYWFRDVKSTLLAQTISQIYTIDSLDFIRFLTQHNNELALNIIEKIQIPNHNHFVLFIQDFLYDHNVHKDVAIRNVIRLMQFGNFQTIASKVIYAMENKNLFESILDIRLYQEIEKTTIPLKEKVEFFDRIIALLIHKKCRFFNISLIRIYVRLCHQLGTNISLNKYLLLLLSKDKYFGALLSNTNYDTTCLLLKCVDSHKQEIITRECFPVDKTLLKCFKYFFKSVEERDIFGLLLNNTMFSETTTRRFLKKAIFDNMINISNKKTYFDSLKESLMNYQREELLLFSNEPCEMVAHGLQGFISIDYYLQLFPNLNQLRVGLELLIFCDFKSTMKFFDSLQKKYPVDQDIVNKVVRKLGEIGNCYSELEYLSTFPFLRKFLKNALSDVVDEILDGSWDYSNELCKMINEGEDVRLENQLYRNNDTLRFYYDLKGSFVKTEFTPKALQYTFENSAPYAKKKACSFLHSFIDDRAELRNIKIAHSQILPKKLLVKISRNYSKELKDHKEIHQELISLRENKIFQYPEVINDHRQIKPIDLALQSDDCDSIFLKTTFRYKLSESESSVYISWEFFYVRSQLKSLTVDVF